MRASPGVKNKTIERDGIRMSSVFRIAVLSGMALLWGTFAMLWMPWADYQKSYRSVALQLKARIPSSAKLPSAIE